MSQRNTSVTCFWLAVISSLKLRPAKILPHLLVYRGAACTRHCGPAKVNSSHDALSSGDIPAAPHPSELPQLHQRGASQAWCCGWSCGGGRKKQKKNEGGRRTARALRFPNHVPAGFRMWRWGRNKQFCLSCLCCVALSFRGLFCSKPYFLFFSLCCWWIKGMINADPLPVYSPTLSLVSSVLGRFPRGN